MFRLTLLLALLGVAHCIVWGFHNHDGGPDDDDNDSGPDHEHGHGHGHGHGWGWGHHGHGGGHHGCGRHGHPQNLTWHSEYDRRFERLSAYMIRADRYSKDFCDRYTPNNVQESQGPSVYSVVYNMPALDPNNIAVKIKHRVLYMYARQSDSQDSPTYVDVKILPDNLKLSDASWSYGDDKLNIYIPYEPALTVKIMKVCVDVNADVKDVPQKSQIIYKFNSDNANF